MSWRARIWTRIAAAFMALVALLLVAGSGLAQELDYILEKQLDIRDPGSRPGQALEDQLLALVGDL